jgi:hypothetical protein
MSHLHLQILQYCVLVKMQATLINNVNTWIPWVVWLLIQLLLLRELFSIKTWDCIMGPVWNGRGRECLHASWNISLQSNSTFCSCSLPAQWRNLYSLYYRAPYPMLAFFSKRNWGCAIGLVLNRFEVNCLIAHRYNTMHARHSLHIPYCTGPKTQTSCPSTEELPVLFVVMLTKESR